MFAKNKASQVVHGKEQTS